MEDLVGGDTGPQDKGFYVMADIPTMETNAISKELENFDDSRSF